MTRQLNSFVLCSLIVAVIWLLFPTQIFPNSYAEQSNYSLVTKWGVIGSGKGQLDQPSSISVDRLNKIAYVADINNNRIQKFTYEGKFISSWGSAGKAEGQFNHPGDVAVDQTNQVVYVSDIENSRIESFDKNGSVIMSWGSFGKETGKFDHPGGIGLDPASNVLYVTDIGNNRIQKFTSDGKYMASWGNAGSENGQFNRPAGIAIDSSEKTIYVTDTKNNRIQVFDPNGNFIFKWGSTGTADGQFNRPTDIAVDSSTDRMYVTDSENHRVQIFDRAGHFVSSIQRPSDKEILEPTGIAIDPINKVLFVVDKTGNDILKISVNVPSLTHINTAGNNLSSIDSSSRAGVNFSPVANDTSIASSSEIHSQNVDTLYSKYINSDQGFQISYPSDWSKNERGGSVPVLFTPTNFIVGTKKPIVFVSVEEIPNNITNINQYLLSKITRAYSI